MGHVGKPAWVVKATATGSFMFPARISFKNKIMKGRFISIFLLAISIFIGMLGVAGIINGLREMISFGFSLGSLIDYGSGLLFGLLLILPFAIFLYKKAPRAKKFLIVILIILGILFTIGLVRGLTGATARECQERLPRYERCAGGCNLVWPHSEYLNSECLKDCIRSNKVERCFTLDEL
ncbi:MAG: hypothetical protein V1756_00235 [Patescibacteria group bacterium]